MSKRDSIVYEVRKTAQAVGGAMNEMLDATQFDYGKYDRQRVEDAASRFRTACEYAAEAAETLRKFERRERMEVDNSDNN